MQHVQARCKQQRAAACSSVQQVRTCWPSGRYLVAVGWLMGGKAPSKKELQQERRAAELPLWMQVEGWAGRQGPGRN